MRLVDKVAIITGGSKGIGYCMAQLFVAHGAKVIVADVNAPVDFYEGIDYHFLDVSDEVSCLNLVDDVILKYGKIDVLVNNAGITKDSLTKNMDSSMFDLVIDVNLKGVFNVTKAVCVKMMEAKSGSIINVSSIVGQYGNIGQANYAASKAGVIGMAKSWAKEFSYKGANVRVNTIAPGYIMTDILKTVPDDLLNKFASMTMLGRLGEVSEVANVALFLASDESSYVTGSVIDVNGGMRL